MRMPGLNAAVTEGWGGLVYDLPLETTRRFTKLLNLVQRRTDMDQLLGIDGSRARIRLFVKSADYDRAAELIAELEENLPVLRSETDIQARFSGDPPVAQAVVGSIVTNTLRSAGWTLAGIVISVSIFVRSVRETNITILPLGAGVTLVLGVMGHAVTPLGVGRLRSSP